MIINFKYYLIIVLIFFSFNSASDDQKKINRPFKEAGSVESLINPDINYKELILVQLDLLNDSLFDIVSNSIPELNLLTGPSTYHRIFPLNYFNRLEEIISSVNYQILERPYLLPEGSREYWIEVKQGGETAGIWSDDDAIEYTCACLDNASDCIKLGWDDSWWNPLDYWGEAWWGFIPPVYSSINEIRVIVKGAQCDDLPVWSESYMGMRDSNGNWSHDYTLSIEYTENIFVVPEVWNGNMLMPIIGSEDNYVIDEITLQFFYTCLFPGSPNYVVSSDGNYCDYINISWEEPNSNADIIGYNIYKDGILLSQLNSSTYNFTDYSAVQDVVYDYCITSINECGESENSCNTGFLKIEPAPTNFINASDGLFQEYVYVAWDPSWNASYYNLYRDGFPLGIIDSSLYPEYIDYYIDYGIEHNYCVESINECGTSGWVCDLGYGSLGLGDINNDSIINVLDIVLLINIIMEELDLDDIQFWASDINNDDQINVLDIVMLINLILG